MEIAILLFDGVMVLDAVGRDDVSSRLSTPARRVRPRPSWWLWYAVKWSRKDPRRSRATVTDSPVAA
jgi:hypothetical protein